MENNPHSLDTPESPFRMVGFWGLVTGGLALILVFIQITAPMFEPSPSVGSQIGEIAADIKRSAWSSFFGEEQEVDVVAPAKWKAALALAGPILGVIAVVLSVVSGVRRENWRFSVYGASLGASAIVFQFFWWVALLVAGVVLLVAIIENIGDIFSF